MSLSWNRLNRHVKVALGVIFFLTLVALFDDGLSLEAPTPRFDPAPSDGMVDVTRLHGVRGVQSTRPTSSVAQDLIVSILGARKASAAGYTIDVTSLGAVGDGVTDDSAAFQAAATGLANTGGVIWVPPNRTYLIGTQVDIETHYPIWLVSGMGNHALPGGGTTDHPEKALIKPKNALTYMFRWAKPDAETEAADAGGGGMIGISIGDMTAAGGTVRNYAMTAAVYVESGPYWTCRDCNFSWIKGSALKFGRTTVSKVLDSLLYQCGDSAGGGRPAINIGDGTIFAGVYIDNCFIEQSQGAANVKLAAASSLRLTKTYFEDGSGAAQKFCDFAAPANVSGCNFNANTVTSIASTAQLRLIGNTFANSPTTQPTLDLTGAENLIEGNDFYGSDTQTGKCIVLGAGSGYTKINNNTFKQCGNIDASATSSVTINGNTLNALKTTETYCIKAGANSTVNGNIINGGTTTAAHGILGAGHTTIVGNQVFNLNSKNGVVASAATDTLADNDCHDLGMTGIAIIYANGCVARNNQGYTKTATISGTPGTVTLNSERGTLTTPSLNTTAGNFYTTTVTNSMCSTTSTISFTLRRDPGMGGDTQGTGIVVNWGPLNGSFTVSIGPATATAFNGSWIIDYVITN
jgi:hypothetical protein